MIVTLFNNQKDLRINQKLAKKALLFFLKKAKVKSTEVSLFLVDKEQIQILHEKYFQNSTETDCITLAFDPPQIPGFLGEIYVCPKVAKEYAADHNIDPLDETLLYIVHGLNHLLGFKDKSASERMIMQKNEKTGIKLLKKNQMGISLKQLKKWQA